jgi:hypothetical protein
MMSGWADECESGLAVIEGMIHGIDCGAGSQKRDLVRPR